MDKMIFNSRSRGFYENIKKIATQNNEEPIIIIYIIVKILKNYPFLRANQPHLVAHIWL